jgi:hypothetical protein
MNLCSASLSVMVDYIDQARTEEKKRNRSRTQASFEDHYRHGSEHQQSKVLKYSSSIRQPIHVAAAEHCKEIIGHTSQVCLT